MLPGNDVLGMKREWPGEPFQQPAVFATRARPLTHGLT
jgi:hypothetical protein